MKVPAFILKRLYIKGSLRNTPEGCEFKLKNTLGSGYAIGLLPVTVDETLIAQDHAFYTVDGKRVMFTAVTKESPATLAMNREATITLHGHTLQPGPHKVSMGFKVTGLGDLTFDLLDNLAEG